MEHVDLFTDYVNEFASRSREYEEPVKVLQSLQYHLILSGYCKVHTDKGKGKSTRKRKPKGKHKGTVASSSHVVANDNDNEGTSERCDHGDDALGADNADETNASE